MTSFFDDDLKEEDFEDEPAYVPPKITTTSTASVSFLKCFAQKMMCKKLKKCNLHLSLLCT
jgi:hypothetical protein